MAKARVVQQEVTTVVLAALGVAEQSIQFAQDVGMFSKGYAYIEVLNAPGGTFTAAILTATGQTVSADAATTAASYWFDAGNFPGIAAAGIFRITFFNLADVIRWRLTATAGAPTITFRITVYLTEE